MQIFDCLAEGNGIGGVCLQGFLELDNQGLVFQPDIRLLVQWRREHHVLFGVLKGDVFVEGDLYFLADEVQAVVFGDGSHHHWRRHVLRAACRRHRIGATLNQEAHQKHACRYSNMS